MFGFFRKKETPTNVGGKVPFVVSFDNDTQPLNVMLGLEAERLKLSIKLSKANDPRSPIPTETLEELLTTAIENVYNNLNEAYIEFLLSKYFTPIGLITYMDTYFKGGAINEIVTLNASILAGNREKANECLFGKQSA